ncbi:MAG: hypothetical protein IT374_26215 [Polyangiaceae bacterium]|nr:hypothetical protein [Polyangiaceae bacterium]
MRRSYDHRALRRATDESARAAWWLALALGVAAIVGVALDSCGAVAQTRETVHGVLTWGDGQGPRRVEIRESDLLWLARALVGSQTAAAHAAGHSPSGFAVGAWCRLRAAANRHAAMSEVDARSGRAPRLGDSLREYSTATSSRWRPGGPACGPGGTHVGSPMCGARRLARRAEIRSLSWSSIAGRFGDLRGALRSWPRGDHEDDARAALSPRDYAIVASATHTDQLARRVRLPNAACGSNRYWIGRPAAPANLRMEGP